MFIGPVVLCSSDNVRLAPKNKASETAKKTDAVGPSVIASSQGFNLLKFIKERFNVVLGLAMELPLNIILWICQSKGPTAMAAQGSFEKIFLTLKDLQISLNHLQLRPAYDPKTKILSKKCEEQIEALRTIQSKLNEDINGITKGNTFKKEIENVLNNFIVIYNNLLTNRFQVNGSRIRIALMENMEYMTLLSKKLDPLSVETQQATTGPQILSRSEDHVGIGTLGLVNLAGDHSRASFNDSILESIDSSEQAPSYTALTTSQNLQSSIPLPSFDLSPITIPIDGMLDYFDAGKKLVTEKEELEFNQSVFNQPDETSSMGKGIPSNFTKGFYQLIFLCNTKYTPNVSDLQHIMRKIPREAQHLLSVSNQRWLKKLIREASSNTDLSNQVLKELYTRCLVELGKVIATKPLSKNL